MIYLIEHTGAIFILRFKSKLVHSFVYELLVQGFILRDHRLD